MSTSRMSGAALLRAAAAAKNKTAAAASAASAVNKKPEQKYNGADDDEELAALLEEQATIDKQRRDEAKKQQLRDLIEQKKKQQEASSNGFNTKQPVTPTSTYTPQSGSLVYRSDTIDKAALAQQITALNGGIKPKTDGRAKVVAPSAAPPPQRTAEEIKAHLDRKFKAIHAAYKAAAPKTDEELRAEVMAVIHKVEKKTMSIQDVKAYTKQRDIAQYLRRDKFTDAMLATRIQKRVEDDDDDDDDSVSY